jgi:hypothetical protein
MTIPVYCNAIVNAHVGARSINLKGPTRCSEQWGHRAVFRSWVQQVHELTSSVDEKHALMDLALNEMRQGLLTGSRCLQLEEWIQEEKENDLSKEDNRIATAVSEAVSATLANTRISPCENCLIGMGSIFIALLLFIIGTAPFLFSKGLMDRLFAQ